MAFNPDNILKRYDADEKQALLKKLLEEAKPRETEPPQLVHIMETVEEAQKIRDQDGKLVGLSTGWNNVDLLVRGLRGAQILVVFGDTGHRKSMFVQNVAANVAEAGTPVLFIGLEMSNEENTERFLDMGLIGDEAIIYPPSTDVNYKDIDGIVGAAVDGFGIGLIIIDHLHMFALEGENDASGLNKICVELKRVTRKYSVPMILVSHINEDKQRRGIPTLKDLKGSSGIKQVADKAIAVYSEGVELDAVEDTEVTLMLRKSRVRAEQKIAHLNIMRSGRLVDPKRPGY